MQKKEFHSNITVAFYLNNRDITSVDLTNVEEGNPGIGGSEYLCVLVANALHKRRNINVVLLCDEKGKFPTDLPVHPCGNIENAIKQWQDKIDYIVVDSKRMDFTLATSYPNVHFILWVNNDMSHKRRQLIANLDNIVRLVQVGREMYDLYRDSICFPKMQYIFNAVPMGFMKDFHNLTPYNYRKNRVVYIGSIVPIKGFHLLAKAWSQILKAIPDAELIVMGSGKLYNRTNKMGKYGIAEENYENEFMQYLTDKEGKILPSVHFLGIVGQEKNDILATCKVGVPNPSGLSETFGYTAVEMQLMGCAVTTIECPGYIDTVYDTKLLYKSPKQLSKYIISLLKNEYNPNYESTIEYIQKNFSLENVVDEWENLFINIDKKFYKEPSPRSNYHGKRIKEWYRKSIPLHIRKYLPEIERFYNNRIYRFFHK